MKVKPHVLKIILFSLLSFYSIRTQRSRTDSLESKINHTSDSRGIIWTASMCSLWMKESDVLKRRAVENIIQINTKTIIRETSHHKYSSDIRTLTYPHLHLHLKWRAEAWQRLFFLVHIPFFSLLQRIIVGV